MQTTFIRASRRTAGFTMVELAICIAVVAVAMVAIIGVLPSGLGSQQLSREETIVNQDATVLLEAIRTGAWLSDDLTNYVDYVVIERRVFDGENSNRVITNGFAGPWFSRANVPPPATYLQSPLDVVGALSLPKYESIPEYDAYFNRKVPGQGFTNTVIAQFRAFSGSLNEKPMITNSLSPVAGTYDSSFRYLVRVEISPVRTRPQPSTNRVALTNTIVALHTQENVVRHSLYDVSLTVQWPVFGNEVPARVGNNSRTLRTQVQGRLVPFYFNGATTPYTLQNSSVVPRHFTTDSASANVLYP